jgi:hypothetical protein
MSTDDKLLPYDPEELYNELVKYGDAGSLAKGFSLPTWFVKYELWVCGLSGDSPNIINPELSRWPVEKLRQDLRSYRSLKALSRYYRCDLISLRESLLTTGIFPKAWKRRKYNWIEVELRNDLLNCSNVRELMYKYGCSRSVLMRAFEKFGLIIPACKRASVNKKVLFTKEQLIADYDQYGSLLAISKKYQCSLYKIWYNFNHMDIPYQKMSSVGCKDASRKSRIAMNVTLLQNRIIDDEY